MVPPIAVTNDSPPASPDAPEPPPADNRPGRGRGLKIVLGVGAVLVVLLIAAALWFFLGRDQATELDKSDALTEFRAAGSGSSDAEGLPPAGVYEATATGTESIGLPGFDEDLGPNAPVTVTHTDDDCFVYRADFNSHHWRSWTFCSTSTARFAITQLDSFTARKAPGLDIATLSIYECEEPLGVVWSEPDAGETGSSSCTGTTDMDDSITTDVGESEALGTDSVSVGGEQVNAHHVRTTDTFGGDQQGTETAQWWFDPDTGLPVKVTVENSLTGGASDYSENLSLELTTLTPAT